MQKVEKYIKLLEMTTLILLELTVLSASILLLSFFYVISNKRQKQNMINHIVRIIKAYKNS